MSSPLSFIEACFHGNVENVQDIIGTHNGNVDLLNSALLIASFCGHFQVAELLIKEGANVKCVDANGKSALELALSREDNRIVGLLS